MWLAGIRSHNPEALWVLFRSPARGRRPSVLPSFCSRSAPDAQPSPLPCSLVSDGPVQVVEPAVQGEHYHGDVAQPPAHKGREELLARGLSNAEGEQSDNGARLQLVGALHMHGKLAGIEPLHRTRRGMVASSSVHRQTGSCQERPILRAQRAKEIPRSAHRW